jgi:DNA-directed RNA polymerase subunit omega
MARVSIEDCQKKLPNRFELVMVAADRARRLMEGADPLVSTRNKQCVTALREIADDLIIKKGKEIPDETDVVEIFDSI